MQPLEVVDNPDRGNIKLFVKKVKASSQMEDMFWWLIEMIRTKKRNCPRYLVFCKTIKDCSSVCSTLKINLPESLHDLFDMYHSMTEEEVKDIIRTDMAQANGEIRVLICTSSAGMGVNFKNVQDIVHFGPPMDIDTFSQQIGRAGRLNESSQHLLLYHGRQLRNIDSEMLEYCKNESTCRREILLKHYGYSPTEGRDPHQCCDSCSVSVSPASSDHPAFHDSDEEDEEELVHNVDEDNGAITQEQALLLKQNLEEYMQSEDAARGSLQQQTSSTTVQQILMCGHLCKTADELLERCDLWDFQQAAAFHNIILNTLDKNECYSEDEDYMDNDDW